MLMQVDIDSTLYDANKLFYTVGREEFNINWPRKYSYWFHAEDIGTDLQTLKNVFRRCHSHDYVKLQKPYPGAAQVIRGIISDFPEIEIAYVSDRNESQTSALREWLDVNGFLTEESYVEATKDKRHWMLANKPEIVIDDRVRTMLMAHFVLDAYVLSLKHDYNINLLGEVENLYIRDNWKELDDVLRNIVIPEVQKKSVSRELELA